MIFPVFVVALILEKIKDLEKSKKDIKLGGQVSSTLNYFYIQTEIVSLWKGIKTIYRGWAQENGKDWKSQEDFFYFSAKTGIHKDSEGEFFVVEKKEEDGEVFYLLDVKGDGDDSSDEEDSELWVRKSVLMDCYPDLVQTNLN